MGGRGSSSGAKSGANRARNSAGGFSRETRPQKSSDNASVKWERPNIPTFSVPERWSADGKFVNLEHTERLNQLITRFNRAEIGSGTHAAVIKALEGQERSIQASLNAKDTLDDRGYLRTALRQTRQAQKAMYDYMKKAY